MNLRTTRKVLSENLDALMLAKGWSAPVLERKSGVSDSTINNIRSGGFNGTVDTIQGIAAAFGLPPWALLVPGLGVNCNGQELNQLLERYIKASDEGRIAILRLALSEATLGGR